MTLVRYTNKKTGVVTLYESTSYYDPETKQSRPKRKYLGIEDPVTKELIPSSGKPGRKKKDPASASIKTKKTDAEYRLLYEGLRKELAEKNEIIKRIEHENRILYSDLQRIRNMIGDMLNSKELNQSEH